MRMRVSERIGPMSELNGMITKTKHRFENFAAQAKTAVSKAGDVVRGAAESTGEKVRGAAKSTGEKVRDAATSTARKLEGAGRDVGKKMGIGAAPPKVAVRKLSLAEVRAQLPSIPGWTFTDGKLHREFRFADFDDAFFFMTRAAKVAKDQDHHPEWSNAYDVVQVHLSTHDVGGVSPLDFQLAAGMNARAAATEQSAKSPPPRKTAAKQAPKPAGVRKAAKRSARPRA
jgi:4a-hydroxytetrahydrobiopterin dehydratase